MCFCFSISLPVLILCRLALLLLSLLLPVPCHHHPSLLLCLLSPPLHSTLQKEDSWVRSWKERYWRPWCVARMAPLRCLMNLYQDFASYKLKESCTWTVS